VAINIPETAETPLATTQQCRVHGNRAYGCPMPVRPKETHAW